MPPTDPTVPFVDREVELEVLEKEYRKPFSSLIIVYGRRRIGKTRLLSEWVRDKRNVYYIASQLSFKQLSEEFSALIGRRLGIWTPHDIIEALARIALELREEKVVVVLDEFQYIVDADPSIVSRLQRIIDSVLAEAKIKLVLSGSAVSFFEKKLLGYKSPLFGRRTSSIKLRYLRFPKALGFFPKMGPADCVRTYSILGGTPAYLRYAYDKKDVGELLYEVLSPGSYLLTEAEDFLKQEVREPKTYMAILKAVADGYVRPAEIAGIVGIDPRSLGHYISVLQELDIVTYRRPLGFKKKGRLFFIDGYFYFWFKHVLGSRGLIEAGYHREVVESVKEVLDEYVAKMFEFIVESTIPELYKLGLLETKPVEIGKWWYRGDEIDIIVREPHKTTSFIEVKWSDISMGDARRIIKELERKSLRTGMLSPVNYYIVVARGIRDLDKPDKPLIRIDENRYIIDFTTLIDKHLRRPQPTLHGANGNHD